jgi:exodeoxyribonuclease VII large subunit
MASSRASEAQQFDFSLASDETEAQPSERSDPETTGTRARTATQAPAAAGSTQGPAAESATAPAATTHAPTAMPVHEWDGDAGDDWENEPESFWPSETETQTEDDTETESETGSAGAPAPLPGTTPDAALTVAEFYDRVKLALRSEFPADVWVTGEIRKVSVNKGNRYLELADHDGPPGRAAGAMLDVACWSRDWPLIGAELKSVGLELTAGLVVRIRGRVGVWDGAAKLRFSMTDLDVAALLGGIAAARRKLLLALEREGLLDANRRLPVPIVPIRIGVVTSAGSEAYRDFIGQLERSGYRFDVRLEACAVQGTEAPGQLATAIGRLQQFRPDVIVLVRGGGGKGDLAAFDHEIVARAIATSRHPIWTGIGHTGDRSVADEISQRALITPSGCGEALVAAVTAYVEGIEARAQAIAGRGRAALDRAGDRVTESRARLSSAARHELDQASSSLVLARSRAVHGALVGIERNRAALDRQAREIARISRHRLQSEEQRLSHLHSVLAAFDPKRQLARGWSLTKTTDGRVLRSVGEVAPADQIVTVFADGNVTSSVEQVSRIEETT